MTCKKFLISVSDSIWAQSMKLNKITLQGLVLLFFVTGYYYLPPASIPIPFVINLSIISYFLDVLKAKDKEKDSNN